MKSTRLRQEPRGQRGAELGASRVTLEQKRTRIHNGQFAEGKAYRTQRLTARLREYLGHSKADDEAHPYARLDLTRPLPLDANAF